MNRRIDPLDYSNSPAEQHLYRHWLQLSQVETPAQLITRFHTLFVVGNGYPDPSIQATIEELACSRTATVDFNFVLNRCCYILVNRWLVHPRLQSSIPALIAVFDSCSAPPVARSIRGLRDLTKRFAHSEQFAILKRLAEMVQQETEAGTQEKPLADYMRRYPYLYTHCLLTKHNSKDQLQSVRRLQVQVQRQFEVDLSHYMTHRLLRSPTGLQAPIKNPTLLSDQDLCLALKQFVCKVDGQYTQRDLAQQFLTYSSQTASYRVFKEDLFSYLTSAIAPEYGKQQFYDRLYTELKNTLPRHNEQKLDEFLLLRTCSKLLNFLVVESPQKPQHFVLLDLINNVGTTFSINLLLKIALLSHKVRPHLEKRFSILFHHYGSHTKENGAGWLIEALETLNVALATNFGSINSFLSQC